MERRVAVPAWLGFSWWWLLGATILSNVLGPYLLPLTYCLVAFFFLWSLVQPAWLRFVYSASRAVYWYLAAYLAFAGLKILEFFRGPAVVVGDSWLATALMLAASCCYVVGVCYFAGDLREFVQRWHGYELPISYPWAILFGAYYFQYKLHECFENQRIEGERITP